MITSPPGSPEAVALEWVLTGGEDHALVATFPPGTALPGRWRVIGEVRAGAGVTVDGAPQSARRLAALPLTPGHPWCRDRLCTLVAHRAAVRQ